MGDPDEVGELRFRHSFNASHLRRLQCATDKDAEFKGIPFGAYKEVAGLSRKHDRLMGGIDSLISKRGSGFAQAVPGIAQITREASRRYRLSSRPAVVRFPLGDPLLAVVAFPAGHKTNCDARRRFAPPCVILAAPADLLLFTGYPPARIFVETGRATCNGSGVGSQILLVDHAVWQHDKRHHARGPILRRISDQGDCARTLARLYSR